jgi:ribosome-binding protein aMBF1 (putative translation factor)
MMAKRSIHDPRYKKLIDSLINARKKADITQQMLADKLNRPQSYVAKYENRERRLDLIELKDICKCLGIKPEI